MKVLVQKNIWQEYSYDRFLQSMLDKGIDFKEVGLIPFTQNFTESVDFIPDYIFGSTRFVHVCRNNYNFPTFPGFSARPEFYPPHLYINNGEIVRWGDVQIESPKFIKPFVVEKFFTGRVFENQEDLSKAQLSTSFIENENDVLVVVSEPVTILEEYRFFVIGNKISTASTYKPNRYRIDQLHPAWQFLQNIFNYYGYIADGFVIDIGKLSNNSYKIVELNCIQSSGLYEIDTDQFCQDLLLYYNR